MDDTNHSKVTPPVRGSTGWPPVDEGEPVAPLNTAVPAPGLPMSQQPDTVVVASADQPDPATSEGAGPRGPDVMALNDAVIHRTLNDASVAEAQQALREDSRLRNRGIGDGQATGDTASTSSANKGSAGQQHASSTTDVGVMRSVPQTPPPDAE